MALGRRRVVWAARARQAFQETLAYIALDSPQAARELLVRILQQADSLVDLSERGRVVPEVGDPKLRELLVTPHRLLYEVHPTQIQVVAFLHQRQDFTRLQQS